MQRTAYSCIENLCHYYAEFRIIVIGVLIILNYMNAPELIPLAIYSEVVFGSLQNLINLTGDIVTAAEFERKEG